MNFKGSKKYASFLLVLAMLPFLSGGEALALPKIDIDQDNDLELYQQVQVWNITTLSNDPKIGTRNNTYIRRGRIGAKGHFYKKMFFYNAAFNFDNLGKDGYTKTFGSAQSTDNSAFNLTEAYFTLELDPAFNFSFGYFKPQIGRENMSSDFDDSAMEKTYPVSFLRTHVIGRSSGRETGINLGGIKLANMWSLTYNAGIFNPNNEKITGGKADSGNGSKIWSPVYTGRIALTVGDPEIEKYKLGTNYNFFGKRNGVTLGANASYNGGTDNFNNNSYLGFDLLANYQNLNFDAEYGFFNRQLLTSESYTDKALNLKLSYNIPVFDNYIIEPAVMYAQSFIEPKSMMGSSSERYYDIGFNWYQNKNNLKVGTHYIQRQDLKDASKNSSYYGISCQLLY
jgi:hypothetical protein